MSISNTMKRSVAIAALVSAIACTSAWAGCHTIETHGYWESVTCDSGATGARTLVGDDRALAILIHRGSVNLRLHGPWNFDEGDLARVSATVDGTVYRANARAVNDEEVEVRGLSRDFVTALITARTAVFQIGNGRWNLNLYGLRDSLRDVLD